MLLPDNPPLVNALNILMPVIPLGIHALHPNSALLLRPLTFQEQRETKDEVSVSFILDKTRKGKKRERSDDDTTDERLFLEIANGSALLPGSITVSLPKSAHVRIAATGESPNGFGVLHRTLPRDSTPSLPVELGERIDFVTLTAVVPPLQCARLCSCSSLVEKSGSGFVFLAGIARPHPFPDRWAHPVSRVLNSFPLQPSQTQISFLCTQGFGGAGHHRGLKGHHAADFMCEEGTPVLAVFDGVVTVSSDTTHIGGAHVDLLPEANTIHIKSKDGLVEAVYLHLSPLSSTVCVGAEVKSGDVIAKAGSTGFSTGAHLHIQINQLDETSNDLSTVSWSLPWESQKVSRPLGVFPVAGYHYNLLGWIPPVESLELLRSALIRSNNSSGRGLKQLLTEGLLWMKPLSFDRLGEKDDEAPHLQSLEKALRAFPSSHTCLVSNVLAFVSVLREGSQSRFFKEASIPPVYLSCALNFERDPVTGELFSVEPVCGDQQIEAKTESKKHKEVQLAHDPIFRSDFLSYFKHEFILEQLFEVWSSSGDFLRNERGTKRPLCASGEEVIDVYSFSRTRLETFESDIQKLALGKNVFGVSLVFRSGSPDTEPFGIFLGFCKLNEELVIVDLQNSMLHSSLIEAVSSLSWEEKPRNECFYALAR
jgi:murein DD-endopeptidase MepM/ murein hydrolase activator NlpD